nr:MAG TPA: chromosome segregation ATPase [Caudoviricetes sp.]
MDDNTSQLSDIINFKNKLLEKLKNCTDKYGSLGLTCQSFIKTVEDSQFIEFLSNNNNALSDLNYVYDNIDFADLNLHSKLKIIDILKDISIIFTQYKSCNSISAPTSVDNLENNIFLKSDIKKRYDSIKLMEEKIRKIYNSINQKKVDELQSKINTLSAATKKITTDDIDNLNYAIKNTQVKAQEIQKLEEQINSKLTDWNSEHKNNLLAEYTKLKEEFKNDIDTIKQEVENVKTKTTSEIKQNIDLFTSECKKKFDDSYTTFNQIHENNQERYQKLYDNVTESLANLNNEIQKEELAQYFQLECKKLKGKINPLIISFSLFLTIMFYQLLLGTDFYNKSIKLEILFKPIVSYVSLLFISLIITQFISNLVTYNTKSSERRKNKYFIFKSLTNQDTIKELLTPYWCWLIFIFIGMYFIGHISYNVYTKNMENAIHSIQDILPNMPFFMIMVWFTWFASKQFSYIKQICDEYEYKYALSKSYLSYKKEAGELSTENKSLLVSLLDSVIRNIATSPVQSVKADCHTPFSEVFNSLKSASDIVKKDKTTP